MDVGVEFWDAISSWFTPTILFCFLNLMVTTIFMSSRLRPKTNNEEQQKKVREDKGMLYFFRIPSFLDRLKSIKKIDEEESNEGHVARTMPETIVVVNGQGRGGVKMMRKAQGAKIRELKTIDAKADDFINRFRQQLRMQRIESLLKYRGVSN